MNQQSSIFLNTTLSEYEHAFYAQHGRDNRDNRRKLATWNKALAILFQHKPGAKNDFMAGRGYKLAPAAKRSLVASMAEVGI